jgi:DNA-binding MarR family transcriptional regulator
MRYAAAMPRPTKATVAAEAWRNIFDFIIGTLEHRTRALRQLGLTPNDVRALATLDQQGPLTMRGFAAAMRCDASTATWIVDRLEARDLAHRQRHATDRRVTIVALTPAGAEAQARVLDATYRPPEELLALDLAELVALRDATASLRTTIEDTSPPDRRSAAATG